jgi:hypothetical protein
MHTKPRGDIMDANADANSISLYSDAELGVFVYHGTDITVRPGSFSRVIEARLVRRIIVTPTSR